MAADAADAAPARAAGSAAPGCGARPGGDPEPDSVENLLRAAEGCVDRRARRKVYLLKDFVPGESKAMATPLGAMEEMQRARRKRRREKFLAEQFELPIAAGSQAGEGTAGSGSAREIDVEFKSSEPVCNCEICQDMRAGDGARDTASRSVEQRAAEILAQATVAHELLEACWMGADLTEAITFAQVRLRRVQEIAEGMLK